MFLFETSEGFMLLLKEVGCLKAVLYALSRRNGKLRLGAESGGAYRS